MPLYEYQCDACGRRFERIRKFSDPPIEVCPTCGGKVQKLVSSPAFHLKGTGWYATDYSRKDKGESASGSSSSSDKGNDKGDKGNDKASDKASDKGSDSSTSDSAKSSEPKASPAGKDSASSTKESKPATPSTGKS
jgi:putative FmdB family regulatory protein